MKRLIAALVLTLAAVPAFAIDTAVTYSSGILVLLFVGFCSLIVVMQLVPAVMILIGAIKAVKPVDKKVTNR